jgi:ribosome-binding factor A
VSTFESEDALLKAVSGLNSAAGFIQGRISRSMRLRLTPKLTFHADQGIREGFEITGKIRDLGT